MIIKNSNKNRKNNKNNSNNNNNKKNNNNRNNNKLFAITLREALTSTLKRDKIVWWGKQSRGGKPLLLQLALCKFSYNI